MGGNQVYRYLLFLTLLFVAIPAISFYRLPEYKPDPFISHWHKTERLFKRYQPKATVEETYQFSRASFYGVWGHSALLPLVASISCREGGFATKSAMGRMGGHKATILAGSKRLDGPITDKVARWAWLKKRPDHMVACLCAQFAFLYNRLGEEHAIRGWVKGENWRCEDAKKYYIDVQIMKRFYEGGQ